MSDFMIATDSMADLPDDYVDEHGLGIMHLTYHVDGETYGKDRKLDWKTFYDRMRDGSTPTTSQVNPSDARSCMEECLEQTSKLLCLMFSATLSGTYNSAVIAAEELMEERPGIQIQVVDTKAASLGEGLLVCRAVEMMESGCSMEETKDWVTDHIGNLVEVFTVEDLKYLYRGGRISRAAAAVGTVINLKPVLHIDNDGKLVAISKVRGRKKSLRALVDYMDEKMGRFREENLRVYITHGDALEEAEALAQEIRERFGIEDFMINRVGPTIGAHSGPGTMALFFLGEER